jgi:hypothetical protein
VLKMRAVNPSRVVAAIAILVLATGTALAASPSPDASPAADPSASAAASPSEVAATPSPSPSPSPSASPIAATPTPSTASPSPEPAEASESPETDEPDRPPTAAEAADIVAKLKAAGISTTTAAFQALAAQVGTGGAVRTLAFAQASGRTPAQIVALRESGMGWGKMKKELGLNIGPGIGWIMGGGNGKGHSK